ncbi:hypothetical protein FKM82_028859 [Ascaphus truei]
MKNLKQAHKPSPLNKPNPPSNPHLIASNCREGGSGVPRKMHGALVLVGLTLLCKLEPGYSGACATCK